MKRLLVTIIAICATALFTIYCTSFEFDNPLDARNKHTLTVNSNLAVGGTVSPAGTSTRSGGDEVVVTATAAAGYRFTGWLGAVSSTSSSVRIIMNGNKTLTANFAQIQYTLTVDRNPVAGGSVTVNGSTYTSPTTHNSGASVTVRATPSSGYAFTGWSGASSSTNSEISVTMSDNRTETANFQKTFTDSRDGRMYRTVVMSDGKTWMSENLNYANNSWSHNDVTGSIPGFSSGTLGSWCDGNNASNCNTYGRLYTWDAAREACPMGWRLPTRDDWGALAIAAGGTSTYGTSGTAGTALKSQSG